ncbi:ParA family protein [Paenibacillus castaneae]|uniref:ParA family protein n=2 Tax=Paenibacillus castaneae TaxID=474957 RepID=UPI000C9B844A|nr:ParA family protein [Paenibacillus castaneae]
MKYQLALVVKEQEYLKRLADYVRDSPLGEQWQVTAFTHSEAYKQYVKQGYKIDLLVAQPELLSELKDMNLNIPIVALVMKLGESKEAYELHQYQPLPLLLQRLAEIHARAAALPAQMAALSATASAVKVISVYSASGGTGKTALALHLVHAASSHQYRTFYLNLERWNTANAWLGRLQSSDGINSTESTLGTDGEGLSELLYGMKAQPEQSVRWLMDNRKRHPLLKGDYIEACSNLEDRLTLSAEDALELIDIVARSGQYDLIVVDLDDGLDVLHTAVFEQSDQVLWVINDDASVRNKQMLAIRYGEQKWSERFSRLKRKFLFVRNRSAISSTTGAAEWDGLAHSPVVLPEVPEWRGISSAMLLSSPIFRAAVDKLFKYMMKEGGDRAAER